MHNTIYELSRTPVPLDQRARAGNMPDWFFARICDYTENPTPSRRKAALKTFVNILGRYCKKSGEKLTLSPQIKEVFFQERYEHFRAAAEALARTDYPTFAGLETTPAFHLALEVLRDSYEDRRGIYIYSAETGALVTLEHWLRNADFSRPFYIGGIIDYYYQSNFDKENGFDQN